MRTALSTLAAVACVVASTPVSAQPSPARGGLITTTDYAVFASSSANTSVNGVASGTSLPPLPFAIRAAEGAAGRIVARASTTVQQPPVAAPGTFALQVMEDGMVSGNSLAGGPSAGTSSSLGRPSPGPHGLAWHIAAIPAGTPVSINIGWTAGATAGAATSVSIDVDGDGTPDFQHRVSGSRDQQRQAFRGVAGQRGVVLSIRTGGTAQASPAGTAQATYTADLFISVTPSGSGGPTCNFRPFGPECSGQLTGGVASPTPGTRAGLGFRLGNAPAGGVALFVIGDALSTPLALPGSRCTLAVNPRAIVPQLIDANGNAGLRTMLPSAPFSIDVQAVTVELAPAVRLGSSNALNVSCR